MNKDYAIIFQKFEHEEVEYYLPIDVTEGIYLEKNNTFTAHNITLKHIIAGEDYGYCNRENITALINKHKYMPMFIAKKIILNEKTKEIFNSNKKKFEDIEDVIIKDIPESDIDTFLKVIELMKENIEKSNVLKEGGKKC